MLSTWQVVNKCTDDGRRNHLELKECNVEGGMLKGGFSTFQKGPFLKFPLAI